MAQILDMPQLSDTMKIGVLQKWRKNEGDAVSPGEVIAEVETDKAVMDFEAFDKGVLLKRLINDGASVPVGAPIAIIGKAGEDVSKLIEEANARSAGGGKPEAKKPADKPQAKAAEKPAEKPEAQAKPEASKPAAKAAPAANGQGPRTAAQKPSAPATAPAAGTKVLASPLARKLATDLGIDLRQVQGTGPGGRIVERDVKGAAQGGSTGSSPAEAEEAAPSATASAPRASSAAPLPEKLAPERRAETRPAAPAPADDVVKPLSMMRRTIATRLVEAKTTIPHFYLTADVDMDAAMEFREQVAQVHGSKLSVNDLVLKACALGLRRIPDANASFTEEAIVYHARVDIGMAVSIPDGLLTPVIRDADKKTIGQIAAEARELAARARDRKLRPEEMTGGTFSVSNLGMMGIHHFQAIINPPEGAILAVGTVRKEPVVKGDKIVVGQRMSVTLSCDHRVIDGALGAKLLQAIVAILEKPISLAF